jgi:hypothetical protein
MNSYFVQLRVRKARKQELFNDRSGVFKGVAYILRSIHTQAFSRCRSTSDDRFDLGEFYLHFSAGMVYVQQVESEVSEDAVSTSITIPLQVATIHDVALSKTTFRFGKVFFKLLESGEVHRRMRRIEADSDFGMIARLVKEKRLLVQQPIFNNTISINPAFAKAQTQQSL